MHSHTDPSSQARSTATDLAGPARQDAPGAEALEHFLPDGPCADYPTVTVHGLDVVVLGRRGTGVEVYQDQSRDLRPLDPQTPATPITDPPRREALLCRALALLATTRTATRAALTDLQRAEADHRQRLAQIRDYAIEHHRHGEICREGLHRFLTEFDFHPYPQRLRVTYTITGSYQVDTSDPDEVRDDAEGYLKPDLAEIDHLVDDSDTFTVSIDEITEIDH